MAIRTIPNHTIDMFYVELGSVADCLHRIKTAINPQQWRDGDMTYILEQLDKARTYLFGARSVAEAQRLSLQGFTHVEVRSEV